LLVLWLKILNQLEKVRFDLTKRFTENCPQAIVLFSFKVRENNESGKHGIV